MRVFPVLIIVALFALLGASLWYLFDAWTALDFASMPGWMLAAMIGGVFFSLLIGCGLMALMFYSSRQGYDERANREYDR